MLVLIAIVVLSWIGLTQVAEVAFARPDAQTSFPWLAGLGLAGLLLPVANEALAMLRFQAGDAMVPSTNAWTIALIMIGAAAFLVDHGSRLWRSRGTGSATRPAGKSVVATVAAAYLVAGVIDHVSFFHPPLATTQSGVLYLASIPGVDKVQDARCDTQWLFVQDFSAEEAFVFRCPSHDSFPLGRYSSAPFIVWPHYAQGQSSELATIVRDFLKRAGGQPR